MSHRGGGAKFDGVSTVSELGGLSSGLRRPNVIVRLARIVLGIPSRSLGHNSSSLAAPRLHFDKTAPPARVRRHEVGYPKP